MSRSFDDFAAVVSHGRLDQLIVIIKDRSSSIVTRLRDVVGRGDDVSEHDGFQSPLWLELRCCAGEELGHHVDDLVAVGGGEQVVRTGELDESRTEDAVGDLGS